MVLLLDVSSIMIRVALILLRRWDQAFQARSRRRWTSEAMMDRMMLSMMNALP